MCVPLDDQHGITKHGSENGSVLKHCLSWVEVPAVYHCLKTVNNLWSLTVQPCCCSQCGFLESYGFVIDSNQAGMTVTPLLMFSDDGCGCECE